MVAMRAASGRAAAATPEASRCSRSCVRARTCSTSPAANGTDKGCFEVNLDKWQPAVAELEKKVLAIKAKGDKSSAQKLFAEYVEAKGDAAELRKTITERMLRQPRASFVYSITQ